MLPALETTSRAAPRAVRRTRFAGIEGLRACAALSVLAMHVWQVTGTTSGLHFSRLVPMPVTGTWLDRLFLQGILGVQLFFVLSGLLLFYPFACALVAGAPLPRIGTYLMRRARRIYPLYLVVLAAYLAAMFVGSSIRHDAGTIATNALLLQAYAGDMPTILPLAWTLPIEIGYYLLVPVLALALHRRLSRVTGANRRAATIAAVIVLGGAASLLLRLIGLDRVGDLALGRTVAWYFDSFAAGMLVALVLATRRTLLGSRLARSAIVSGIAVFALGAYVRTRGFEVGAGDSVARDVWQTLIAVGCALSVGGIVAASARTRAISHLLDSRLMRWMGEVSYGIYLWHWVVLSVVRRTGVFDRSGGMSALLVNGALVLPATLLLAGLTFRFVEQPLMRRRA